VSQILDEELGAARIVTAAAPADSSLQLTSYRPLRVLRSSRAA
jgi:hypothetical protein